MAPRGRPRKPRLTRMDAAVDAMVQYGFPPAKVRKHVKELLKEYGGDEAWPFIEEFSYKELIEAILRGDDADRNDQEQVTEHENMLTDEDEAPENNAVAEDIAGSSGTAAEHLDKTEDNSPTGASQSSACPSPAANKVPPRRRRFPCYGWIESDEEDDDDEFIVLEAALPRVVSNSPSDLSKSSRKRTFSRWDQRPHDYT